MQVPAAQEPVTSGGVDERVQEFQAEIGACGGAAGTEVADAGDLVARSSELRGSELGEKGFPGAADSLDRHQGAAHALGRDGAAFVHGWLEAGNRASWTGRAARAL